MKCRMTPIDMRDMKLKWFGDDVCPDVLQMSRLRDEMMACPKPQGYVTK